jgi:SAM-dependent methyltransferase
MGEIFERTAPLQPLEWTGERLTTATSGQVEIEHLHRYFLARELCRDLDVLDVASGEGYGSALLAQVARSVVGVELSDDAVDHASKGYVAPNLRYQQGDARNLPLPDACVDAVVSFETIEHFYEHEEFIAEVKRVLRPGGLLIISSPEPSVYSPMGSPANPYHVRELSRTEFESLIRGTFPQLQIVAQRPILGSALIVDEGAGASHTVTFEKRGDTHYEMNRSLARPPYIIAIASEAAIPAVPNSIFIETSEIGAVLARAAQFQAGNNHHLEQEPPTIPEQVSGELNQLRLELERARAELLTACRQRDLLRISFVHREEIVAGLRGETRALRNKVDTLQKETDKLRRKADASKVEAADWKRRYQGLRERLESILHRFGIVKLARLAPRTVRQVVRERLLGSAKPR